MFNVFGNPFALGSGTGGLQPASGNLADLAPAAGNPDGAPTPQTPAAGNSECGPLGNFWCGFGQ